MCQAYVNSFNSPNVDTITLVSQAGKPRHRAQDHRDCKWQSPDLHPDSLAPETEKQYTWRGAKTSNVLEKTTLAAAHEEAVVPAREAP